MPKKRLDVNWDREVCPEDIKPALKRYGRYLEENGLRKSSIPSYVFRVGKFLEFSHSNEPTSKASKKSSMKADCHEAQSIITVLLLKSTSNCVGTQLTSIYQANKHYTILLRRK
jgi:hypothetical protein